LKGKLMSGTKKYKLIEITLKRDYLIPMFNDEISQINGWSLDRVINDWFKNFSLNSRHATRDNFVIGGSTRFIDIKEKETLEVKDK